MPLVPHQVLTYGQEKKQQGKKGEDTAAASPPTEDVQTVDPVSDPAVVPDSAIEPELLALMRTPGPSRCLPRGSTSAKLGGKTAPKTSADNAIEDAGTVDPGEDSGPSGR